ncbi:hypothetical protein SLS62_006836 [Diatrype stigma]|uniref:Uncharacterized protein n=1 Tax=Diatrype stigma TaxID=117547 RepID=A0AAN9UMQ8_9PEZI
MQTHQGFKQPQSNGKGDSPATANPRPGSNQTTYQARSNARYIHPNGQSRHAMVKESWGNRHNFMLSYGLKPYNFEDYDTANQILDQMLEADWDTHHQNQAVTERSWNGVDSPERPRAANGNQLPHDQQYADSVWGVDRQEGYAHGGHVVEGADYGDGNIGYHSDNTNNHRYASETAGYYHDRFNRAIDDNHFGEHDYSSGEQEGKGEQGFEVERGVESSDKESGAPDTQVGDDGAYGGGYNGGYDDGYNCDYVGGYDGDYDGGYDGGYDDGYDGGYDDGYDDGYDGGYDDGYDGGYDDY